MNDQILNALVEAIKEKGESTHNLLKDPLFLSLPLEKQVEAIQAYAGPLAQGSKIAPRGKLLAKAIISGAAAGVFASLPMAAGFKSFRTRAALGIGAAGIGAFVGGVSGTLMYNSEKDRFEKTNKYLIQLAQGPNVPIAVKVLDANRKYEPRTVNSLVKRIASPEQELISKTVEITAKSKENQYKALDATE